MKTQDPSEVRRQMLEALEEQLLEMGEDPGEIVDATRLHADLGLSSIEIIHVMILLEDRLSTPLDFQELAIHDGEYVEDITVGQLLAFLWKSLGIDASG